jgi:glycosyltransferase involved in cell wall biosynthesis
MRHLKTKRLKIGIVARWFWPFVGGVATHTYELVNWLARKGHEVHLLLPPDEYLGLKNENSLRLPCTLHCIRYQEIEDSFTIDGIDNWPYYFKIAFRNAQYIKNLHLDILHGHTPNFSYLTNILGKMINIPTIISLHLSVRLGISISRKCLLHCQFMELDKCLNCSKLGFPNIKERIWNIGIKTYGIDLRRFKFKIPDKSLLSKFKIKKNEKIIFYCGSIYERKGIEYLIQAIPEILRKINDCKLVITGKLNSKDPFHTKIHELISRLNLENKIIFVGYFAYMDIPKLYSIADLFIFPSLEEQQPIVLLEAMAARVPIVTTSLDPIKEVIKDGENGIFVKPRSSEEISRAAIRILKDNKLIQRLVQKGYKTVKKLSTDKVMPEISKIYKQEISKYFCGRSI